MERKCPALIEELACKIIVGRFKITELISLGKFLYEIIRKLEYLAKKIGGEADMAVLCYIQCLSVIGKAIFGFGYWQIILHGLLTAKTGVTRRISLYFARSNVVFMTEPACVYLFIHPLIHSCLSLISL
jgi:hypothetical protein